MLFVVLVLARVAILFVAIVNVHRTLPTDEDVLRFRDVTSLSGRPYRDVQIEYPPGQLAVIDLLVSQDLAASATRLALLSTVCDLAVALIIARTWGRSASAVYLLLGLPLLPFVLLKMDALAVLLAVGGAAAASRKGRERTGGVLIGLGTAVRLWPIILVPPMWIAGRVRTALAASLVVVALLIGWEAYGGVHAPEQVVGFRGATGWEIGSTVGATVWLATQEDPRVEAGAFRVGNAPGAAKAVIALAFIGVAFVICRRQYGTGASPDGAVALSLVSAALFFSPVVSTQYAIWLVPWAAIAWREDDDHLMLATTAVVIGMTVVPVGLTSHTALFALALLVRDLGFAAIVVRFLGRRRAPSPAER
jgi:hypothetical protein